MFFFVFLSGLTDSLENVISKSFYEEQKNLNIKLWLYTSESIESNVQSGFHYFRLWPIPWVVSVECRE